MKKLLSFLCIFTMVFSFTACGGQSGTGNATEAEPSVFQPVHSQEPKQENTEAVDTEAANVPQEAEGSHVLVVYFSATGTTKTLAEYAADAMGADIYEIVPEEPYTSADLDYGDSKSRSSIEQNDEAARPAISGGIGNMDQYDTIFLAYPIWWGEAPRIVCTFMESYDFSGKTIVPFCTSGGSEIGSSAGNLHSLAASDATWMDGERLSSGASREDMVSWINGLGLAVTAE